MTTAYLGLAAAARGQPAVREACSDETLIQRIAAGDRQAMRTLFARHRVAVYRWLLRLVNDEALAEDLLSDVFLDVWRQAASFEARFGFDVAARDRSLQGPLRTPQTDRCRIGRPHRVHGSGSRGRSGSRAGEEEHDRVDAGVPRRAVA